MKVPGRGHEEGRVRSAACGGDHLASSAVNGLTGHLGVQNLIKHEES